MSAFTDDDLREAEKLESLGPEYFAARRVSEAVMSKFEAEHLKPLVEKIADEFRDKLWDDLKDYIVGDTEMNVGSHICQMVEGTVRALLTGEEWAMRRYPFCDYRDGEKIRKAIAEHSGDAIAKARIADLEAELKRVRENLEWHRGSQF